VGGSTDGVAVGPPGTSCAAVGETIAQSGALDPAAVTGLWVGAVTPRGLGSPGGDPVAAGLDGQRALQPSASARNSASGQLFRPVSRAGAGGVFALKAGSWNRTTQPRMRE